MKITKLLKILNVYIRYKINKPIPFSILLRPTFKCNLKCNFCKIDREINQKELSLKKFKTFIDDAYKIGIPRITISGGEPLIRKDIEDIAAYIKSKNMMVNLSTNATLITKKRAKKLVKNFDNIKISVHGSKLIHDEIVGIPGSYENMKKGLLNLVNIKSKFAKIGIRFVIIKKNVQEMDKIYSEFGPLVDFIGFVPYNNGKYSYLNTKANLTIQKINKKIKSDISNILINNINNKKVCDAGQLYFSINPTGEIYPCHKFNPIGNIKNKSFLKIWKKGLTPKQKKNIENCKGCNIYCSTGISILFRKTIFTLIKDFKIIIKTYF
jgi:MoaA/NifB/PqqE/SkfB family radical SAM enzyme